MRDQDLSGDVEKHMLFDYYADHLISDPIQRYKLKYPQTPAQSMMASSVLAFAARAVGDFKRAERALGEARQLASLLLEESSVDAATAFTLLAVNFPPNEDYNKYIMYTNIAHGIAKTLPRKTLEEQRLYYYSLVALAIRDKVDIVNCKKTLMIYLPEMAALKDAQPIDMLAVMLTKLAISFSPSITASFFPENIPNLKYFSVPEDEFQRIATDISTIEWLLKANKEGFGKAFGTYVFTVSVLKALVHWCSGKIDKAVEIAANAIDWDSAEAIRCLYVPLVIAHCHTHTPSANNSIDHCQC
jgi:hypothetical protein